MLDLGEFNYDQDVWAALGVGDPGFDPAKIDVALWRFDEVEGALRRSRARAICSSHRSCASCFTPMR